MSYHMYRHTTLGSALQESLDEFIRLGLLKPVQAQKVLSQFDKSITEGLATHVRSKVKFQAEKLSTYRCCDKVWTLILRDVKFTDADEVIVVDKVKIVACEGKKGATVGPTSSLDQ